MTNEKRPTIVIVTNYYIPTIGGITTYIRGLTGALKRKGYEVSVMAFPEWLSKRENVIQNRLVYRVLHELGVACFIMVVLIKIFLLRLSGKRVVVHSHSASFCLEAGVLARLLGARIVHTFHSPIKKCTVKLRSLIPFANALVCVSEEHRAQYIKTCGISCSTAVIPGGIDCEFFHPASAEDRIQAKNDMAEHPAVKKPLGPVILFVGRVMSEKGVGMLLKAANKVNVEIPAVAFMVIGPLNQSENQRQFVDELRNQINPTVRYHLIGAMNENQLRHAYHAGDIFVFPVLWAEASPMVVVEAMASGLPVIASDIGGLKSQIIDGVNGRLVEPGNSDQLADAILDYLRNPGKASEAGRRSRELAVARYSVGAMAGAYEDIYRKIKVA